MDRLKHESGIDPYPPEDKMVIEKKTFEYLVKRSQAVDDSGCPVYHPSDTIDIDYGNVVSVKPEVLDKFVEKEAGKGLSTEDFTSEDKDKLDLLPTADELTEEFAGKADSFGTDASLTLADGILGISQARRDEVSAAIEAAKKQLFVEIWLQTLAKFSKMPTYAEDVANTKPDGSWFGLNRLVMGYETALKCLIYSDTHHRAGSFAHNRSYNNQQPADIKTLFPVIADNYGGNSCHSMYGGNAVIEAVCLYDNKGAITEPTQASYMFSNCTKLKYIYGTLDLSSASIPSNTNAIFDSNYELTEVRICHVKASLSLAQSPKLSLASIQYLVDNAANTSAITITLHPDAFARLTDDLIELAASKNISFVTP